jgi:hypothetical protein
VSPAHFSRNIVMAERRPNTMHLVGGHAHSDPRAANEYPSIHLPAGNCSCNLVCEIWIIDRILCRGAKVDEFMAQALNQFNDLALDMKSTMVAANSYFHGTSSATIA